MEGPDRLRVEEVARRAGVEEDEARRLADLGLLVPGEDGMFGVGDVRRVRMVHACDEAGIPAEGIARAVMDGKLSLAFLDLPTFR